MKLSWYWRRLRRMEATEPMWRARDALTKQLWRAHQRPVKSGKVRAPRVIAHAFVGELSIPGRNRLPPGATGRLVRAAQRLVDGHWRVFAREHPALGADPDWFLDPRSGVRAPRDRFAFDI